MLSKIILLILIAIVGLAFFIIFKIVKKSEITDNKGKEGFNENIYKKRMNWLLGYFILSILLFGILLLLRNWLSNESEKILFCVASNILGVFLCGFRWRIRSKANPLPAYLLYYSFVILGFSVFTFALTTIILHISKICDDIVFYTLAFFIGIYCGQHVDNIKELGSIIKKIKDWLNL